MKIAFWNCTIGRGSPQTKRDAFKSWVTNQMPDLLILEEVSSNLLEGASSTFGSEIEAYTTLKLVNYVNTLDKNDEETNKCIVALAKNKGEFHATTLRLDGLDAKRGLLKVTHTKSKLNIWGIHANASKSGGEAAVIAVTKYLEKSENSVIGGDFNYRITDAVAKGLKAKCGLSHQGNGLTFTQWNAQGSSRMSADSLTTAHLSANSRYNNITLNPNKVLDYIASSSNANVQPLNNCSSELEWWAILTNFDHCPVIYEVT